MALFTYVAVDPKGARRNGDVEARSKEAAVAVLKQQGLYVLSVKPKRLNVMEDLSEVRGVPFSEVVSFTRQLSTMISAGLSLSKSIEVLAQQTTSTNFKKILFNILKDVEGGSPLASSMAKYPKQFSSTYQALVAAGEKSGKMDEILTRLADTMEAERELRAKFRGAMIYPIIVFTAMIGVFVLLLVFVVPKLAAMYESLDVELPKMTQNLITLSDYLSNNGLLSFGFVIVAALGFRFFLTTVPGQNFKTFLAYRMPVFGNINKKKETTEFTRTLGLLISSAVPIVDALKIVSDVVSNPAMKRGAIEAARNIERGGSLSAYLKSNSAFPPILGSMVATGEETGTLDEILGRLATFFDNETKHAVDGLSAAMEPFILMLLGSLVGFLIITIITPIYKITSAI